MIVHAVATGVLVAPATVLLGTAVEVEVGAEVLVAEARAVLVEVGGTTVPVAVGGASVGSGVAVGGTAVLVLVVVGGITVPVDVAVGVAVGGTTVPVDVGVAVFAPAGQFTW